MKPEADDQPTNCCHSISAAAADAAAQSVIISLSDNPSKHLICWWNQQNKDQQNKDQQKEKQAQSKQQALKNLDAINGDEEKILMKVNRNKGDKKKKSKTKDW